MRAGMKRVGRKRRSHLVEIALILIVFAIVFLANALSKSSVSRDVAASIEEARMNRNPSVVQAENPGAGDSAE